MSIPRSVAEVLREHVVLEVEAIDRMYLNVYVPHLQSVGAVVGYLQVHRGQRFASTAALTPMTEAFVRNIDQFINHEGIDLVAFQKWQRKDDVTQKYLRRFTQCEGVLYVGKAQEKARVMRTERRRSRHTGWKLSVDREIHRDGQPLLFLLRRRGLRAVLPEILLLLSLKMPSSAPTATSISSGSLPSVGWRSRRWTTASSPVPIPS
jgi:hypothetical protein